jgi:hypothetical protein
MANETETPAAASAETSPSVIASPPSAADFGGAGGPLPIPNAGAGGDTSAIPQTVTTTDKTDIPATGHGDEASDPGYAPRVNLREAVEKIQREEAERKTAEANSDEPPQRGPDGKFLPKTGEATPAADGKVAVAGETPAAPSLDDLAKQIPGMGSKDKKRYVAWEASQRAIQARAEAAEKKAAELESRAKELEAKVATPAALPKDLEEEINVLRSRSRQWEITSDPEFQRKYDSPVASTTQRLEQTLVDSWKAARADEAAIKAQLDLYRKEGFSPKVMAVELEWQAKNGNVAAKYQIDRLLSKRDDLMQARADAISAQAADNSTAAAQRAEQTKAQQALMQRVNEIAVKSTGESFTASEADLKKLLPALVAPEPPSDKDSPAVAQTKRAAHAEYDKAVASVKGEFARFAPDPNDPEKTARLTGEFQSLVLLGLLAKNHLIPRAAKEMTALNAAIAERDQRLAAFKKAGSVNGAHLAAAQDGGGNAAKTKLDQVANDPNRKPGDLLRAAMEGAGAGGHR